MALFLKQTNLDSSKHAQSEKLDEIAAWFLVLATQETNEAHGWGQGHAGQGPSTPNRAEIIFISGSSSDIMRQLHATCSAGSAASFGIWFYCNDKVESPHNGRRGSSPPSASCTSYPVNWSGSSLDDALMGEGDRDRSAPVPDAGLPPVGRGFFQYCQ